MASVTADGSHTVGTAAYSGYVLTVCECRSHPDRPERKDLPNDLDVLPPSRRGAPRRHRRGRPAPQRRPARDVDGVLDDLRRRPRSARCPPAEVAHPPRRPDRARADDQPMDLRGRRRAAPGGPPPRSCPASGPSSTAHRAEPGDDETAEIMRKSAAKEHVLMAVMAGLASAADDRAAAVGARIEREARATSAPSSPSRDTTAPRSSTGSRRCSRPDPASQPTPAPGTRSPSLPVSGPGSSYVCGRWCAMMATWRTRRPRCAPGCCSWPRPSCSTRTSPTPSC